MLFFSLLTTCLISAAEPLVLYDLTDALRFDANNRQEVEAVWDHCHTAAALQGIVNRDAPRLYLRYVMSGGRNIDDYWLERMEETWEDLRARPRQEIEDIVELVKVFEPYLRGAVVYDPQVFATSNLASTIAGVEDLLPVRYDPAPDSLYSRLILSGPELPVQRRLLNEDGSPMFTGEGVIPGTDLPSSGSAKCDAHLWLKHHYIDTGKANAEYSGFYIDQYWMEKPTASGPNQHTLTNHDFFIAKRGFFFDLGVWADETPVDDPGQPLGTERETLKALLLAAYRQTEGERIIHIGGFTPWAYKYTNWGEAGGGHDPVPTEWEFVRVASAYNAVIDADAIGLAAMANASFYMHYPLQERYEQPWTSREQLTERGYLTPEGNVNFDGREFIIFYVGDYDSAAWVYQRMPDLWDHPDRGRVPMMWSVSPLLARRAGPMLDYLRRTASPMDYFVAADNGAGYLNPGMLQTPRPVSELPCGVEVWAEHCERYYQRWGITITGFVIDGYAPGLDGRGLDAYARFSPNGIVPQKVSPAFLHRDMPVLRADHDINQGNPADAAEMVLRRVEDRALRFHWFRNILKSPNWYVRVIEEIEARAPHIELLDAPTFFELLRIHLRETDE